MKQWLRRIFSDAHKAPDNTANRLRAELFSSAPEIRNHAAAAILEKAVRIHAPFGDPPQRTFPELNRSWLGRLWDDIKSVELVTVDVNRENCDLLAHLARSVRAGEVNPADWKPDVGTRWTAAVNVIGEKRLDQAPRPA